MKNKSHFDQIFQLVNVNKLNDAEALLDQINPTDLMFYMACFQRGYIRQMQGRLIEAKELFHKALSIKPDFQQCQRCIVDLDKLIDSIKDFEVEADTLYVYWYNEIRNWGDSLNDVLIEKISGKKVTWVEPYDYRTPIKYFAIGSLLRNIDANTIVWGTGAMSETHIPAVRPKEICAVRGPLTRQLLINQGIDCPSTYGDPALLYPRFYNPVMDQIYDIGIVTHYVDKQNPWIEYAKDKGAKIIDIQGGINQVVNDIKSCSRIASSSLHGIIAADAYGIPSAWIEFSDGVIGNGFKFRDYYQSINRSVKNPVRINSETSIEQLDETFNVNGIDIDLDKLFNSCPFLNTDSANSLG